MALLNKARVSMTKSDLIASIRLVLKHKMTVPHLAELCEDTRLGEELALDSVLLLQLLVHLELDLGFEIPETWLTGEHFGTVGQLADSLLQLPVSPRGRQFGGAV